MLARHGTYANRGHAHTEPSTHIARLSDVGCRFYELTDALPLPLSGVDISTMLGGVPLRALWPRSIACPATSLSTRARRHHDGDSIDEALAERIRVGLPTTFPTLDYVSGIGSFASRCR
jgi:hypothetical protein